MKFICTVLVSLALVSSCAAQALQSVQTLTVTVEEANTILSVLSKEPWKDINPLLQKLIAQLKDQNKSAPQPGTQPPQDAK